LGDWVPDTLREREPMTDELVELAQHLDDPRLRLLAAQRQWNIGVEAGDRGRVRAGLETMRAMAARIPDPTLAWTRMHIEVNAALADGDLEAAEQWAIQSFEIGTASGEPDAQLMYGIEIANVRYLQGRYGEIVEQIVQLARELPVAVLRSYATLALIESGRENEARELALAEDFQSMQWDIVWPQSIVAWGDACRRLDLTDRAGELYELLTPFSGQLAISGAGVYGSIDWALGALATTIERYEQAEGHFAAAAEIEERLGAPLFLARTRAGWAHMLIARGRREELDRAQSMLEQAGDTAQRLGAEGVAREVATCNTALTAIRG
jgi:tetratricopeptide (TPR) repeat protein